MAEGDGVIDLKSLLGKYIRHIRDYEGTDFLDPWCRNVSLFSDKEWNTLVELRDFETKGT